MKINVLSFNIHKGKYPKQALSNVNPLLAQLKSKDIDLVLLQEACDDRQGETTSQCCHLANQLSMDHRYGPNAHHVRGNHGNASLSRFPMSTAYNLNMSISPLEHRGTLYTKVNVQDDLPLHVFNTHFGLTPIQRRKQYDLLTHYIKTITEPDHAVIIAGDFNDFGRKINRSFRQDALFTDVLTGQLEGDQTVPTWPSHKPKYMLDHIYFRNLELVGYQLLTEPSWSELSDHIAIYATFLLPNKEI